MKIPIALQLYSVRNDCAADLLGVIDKVAKMGYQGVEFAGYHGHDAKSIRKALDAAGVKAEGTHIGLDQLEGDKLGPTLEFHTAIDCKFLIVPWIPEEMRNSEESCKATGARMAAICEKLRPLGFRTGFHAHEGDMRKLAGGKSAWDLLAAATPSDFILQYDTANGMAGGADPVDPILDWPGRTVSLHIKEWAGAHGAAIIGEGDIPWVRVFEAAETKGGTEWYVVEHEDETLMPPMQAVEKCLANLRKLGK